MKNTSPARPLRLLVALLVLLLPLLTTAGDWPSYLHDGQSTAANGDETTLSPSNAGRLAKLWTFKTGGKIASSPTVVNGVVYVGSWDGYEYALNATTGALAWRTYLGVTSAPNCNPTSAGVTSVAAVQHGVVYVGGGDAYWYALDASTGAVLWKVYTGDNSASGGHYNWASPLLSNGYAYIGIASFGDCPLVQGQLLQVSLSTHQVVNTYNFVPSGQTGAGIWTSPTIDAASNTVYVTTGTQAGSQPLAQAVVALDAATLALKGSWQIPAAQAISDSDWGTTPIVFDDATGTHLVAAADKNGYLYAYDRADVTAGPLWQQKIGNGGSCPQCGDGMASSGAFANGRLYYASGSTTINNSAYPGSVRALNPATGAYLWEHGSPALIVPAIADANGLIVDGAGSTLEVLNASTGAPLYSYVTGGTLWGAPSVANGQIFEGSTDGYVYAFGLVSPLPSTSVDLRAASNNAGISDDAAPSQANLDGVGYSYSAQALQAAGFGQGQSVTVNGVTFQWPAAAPGTADNVTAQGQTISVGAPTGGTTLAVLGAATNGPSTGTGTITYGDGSTQSFTLSLPDWTLNAGGGQLAPGGAQLAATMPYRNGNGGKQTLQTDVFYAAITLQAGKAVASVTLPAAPTQGQLHVFAMTVAGAASSPPATATSTPPALPIATSTSTPPSAPTSTSTPLATNTPGSGTAPGSISLSSADNNAGISDDAAPSQANLDGVGYSYSAQALQAAGFGQGQSVTVNGVTFQWPAAASGTADNVLAQGQTLTLATPTGGTTLAVLGAATNGPSTGTGTIIYSDGSTQSFTLGFSDWTLNGASAQPIAGNSVAATMPYRNGNGGKQTLQTDVFYAAITLQAGKAVARVTLPASANQGHLHIFAMTVSGSASSPTPTATSTPPPLPGATSTPPPLPGATSTPSTAGAPAATALFATGFESGDRQPTWANTVDGGGYPAGGLSNVGGICCGLSGPEAGVRTEAGHTGAGALMYSGMDTSASSSYAYDKVFDLTDANIVVGPTTTLSYWIYPQSSSTAPEPVGAGNSACVAIDLIFADGSNLRDSGAVDQSGNRLHPVYQCGHLTPDTWNHVTSVIGAVTSGKTIVRLDVGYDQPANTGGYRGYIDDISIHN